MCLEEINNTSSAGEKSASIALMNGVLNDVRFSVIGGLCHDVMHDLLQGVLPYKLRLLLEHMFNAKYLILAQYNDQVTSFDYGYTELSSKPNELLPRCFLEKLKLRYSDSEM